jgi:prepilin-type N-terminal cleavage/methylation domain-containing protein
MRNGAFTLIEVILAMAIFLIGTLGILPLFIKNIRYNESVQVRLVAQKVLEDEAADLRNVKAKNFTRSNLQSMGFVTSQPSEFPAVPSGCPSGYEYVMYKGKEHERIEETERPGKPPVEVKSAYRFTLKLCVDDDYLKPYLKRALLWVYWIYRGRLHWSQTEIFITEK